MYRGTTPLLTFELPEPINIEVLFITFQQKDRNVLEKTLDDVSYDKEAGIISLQLSQADTLSFNADEQLWAQIRLRDDAGNAPASEPILIDVERIFKEGEI